MKKVFAIILSLLLLSGCGKNKNLPENSGGVPNIGNSGISDETTDNAVNNIVDKPQYDENTAMFIGCNKYGVDDEYQTLYQYNYRGEPLLSNNDFVSIIDNVDIALWPAQDPSTGMMGYINEDGVFIIEPKYIEVSAFAPCGVAVVVMEGEGSADDRYGVIDTKGNEVVPCSYKFISDYFYSGYAVFESDNVDSDGFFMQGIIDATGKIVVDAKYNFISYVYDGYFLAEQASTVYDFSGKKIAERGNLYYDETLDVGYIQYFLPTPGALYRLIVCGNERNGISFNEFALEIFDGECFQKVEREYEISFKRVATTQSGFGYGVTVDGETVIPFQFDQIHRIGNYFVCVKNTSEYTQTLDIYDAQYNKTAENLDYCIAAPWDFEFCMPDGYFCIYKYVDDGRGICSGIIDETGKVIVEPIFLDGVRYCIYDSMAVYDKYFSR